MAFAVAFSLLCASYVAVEGTYDIFPNSHLSTTYISNPSKSYNGWIGLSSSLKDFANAYSQVYGIVDSGITSGSYPSFYRQITKIPIKGGITIIPAPKNLDSFSNALYLKDYSSVSQVPHIKTPPLGIYGKLHSSGYLHPLKDVPFHFVSAHHPQTLSFHAPTGLSREIHYDERLLNYDNSQLRNYLHSKLPDYSEGSYHHGVFGSRYYDDNYHHGNYDGNQESLISSHPGDKNPATIPQNHHVHEIPHLQNSRIEDEYHLADIDHSIHEKSYSSHESEPADVGEDSDSYDGTDENLHVHSRDLGSHHYQEHEITHLDSYRDVEDEIHVDKSHDQIIEPVNKKYSIPTIVHSEGVHITKYPLQEELQEDDLKIQKSPDKPSHVPNEIVKLADYVENQRTQSPASDVQSEYSGLPGENYDSGMQQNKQLGKQSNYEDPVAQKDKEVFPDFAYSNSPSNSYDGNKYTEEKHPILPANIPLEQSIDKPTSSSQTVKNAPGSSSVNEQPKYDQQENFKDYNLEQTTKTDSKANSLSDKHRQTPVSYEQMPRIKNADYKLESEQSRGRSKQYRKYEKPRSSSYEIEILHSNKDAYQHSTPYEQFPQTKLSLQSYLVRQNHEHRKQSQPTKTRADTYQETHSSPLEQKQVFADEHKEKRYSEQKFIYTEQKQDTKDSVGGYKGLSRSA